MFNEKIKVISFNKKSGRGKLPHKTLTTYMIFCNTQTSNYDRLTNSIGMCQKPPICYPIF